MTDLFQRFAEDLQLKGLSPKTIKMYTRAVKQLATYYQKSPDKITDEELRKYFLYNKNERKWSRVASTISLCGIKYFFTLTLKREWTGLKFIRPEKEKKLPVILSRQEVNAILNHVQFPHHRACLKVIYSLGLRIGEGTRLKISDIDYTCFVVLSNVYYGYGAAFSVEYFQQIVIIRLACGCFCSGQVDSIASYKNRSHEPNGLYRPFCY